MNETATTTSHPQGATMPFNPILHRMHRDADYTTREARTWLEDTNLELGSRVATDLFRENRNRRPQITGIRQLARRTA